MWNSLYEEFPTDSQCERWIFQCSAENGGWINMVDYILIASIFWNQDCKLIWCEIINVPTFALNIKESPGGVSFAILKPFVVSQIFNTIRKKNF